jgi:flagellar P-ring protein precursor FlgI
MKHGWCVLLCFLSLQANALRIKDLGRFEGWRDNQLVGYGLVTGLAGTGDTARSKATQQSLANMLKQFNLHVSSEQINSRNAAAVMVTATLPPFAKPGDRLDVTVTSIGDARSLVGGSLLLTPLKAVNGQVYSLAQGAISVGGYRYDSYGNLLQKNHPTVGQVPAGALVENTVSANIVQNESVTLLLSAPDYTTANRVTLAINSALGGMPATAVDASRVNIRVNGNHPTALVALLSQIENIEVIPDVRARVVINERTGTVVSGGNVKISAVTVVHGDLKVAISTEYQVSHPEWSYRSGHNLRTVVVPQSQVAVDETQSKAVNLRGQSSVADIVQALNKIHASPRDVISILQAIRSAGALHAELVIQ